MRAYSDRDIMGSVPIGSYWAPAEVAQELYDACQLFVDSLEGKPIEPEEAIGAIRAALYSADKEDV